MDLAEVKRFWGNNNLRTASVSAVHGLPLTLQDRTLLTEIGLPELPGLPLEFFLDKKCLRQVANLVLIGTDGAGDICIDGANGFVIWVNSEDVGTKRFINSNLENFAIFLTIYEQWRRLVRDLKVESKQIEAVSKLETSFRETDAAAVKDPESFWALVLEQSRDGLL